MMGMLSTSGAEITPRAEDADIIVVNTCSFIDTAKQESVDTILEMVRHKTHGRATKLIVTGCLVERYRDEIQKNIPEIDAVLGTGELADILAAAGMVPEDASPTPFTILNSGAHPHASASQQLKSGQHEPSSRPEGDAREKAGRFARDTWDGATAELPSYLYDENTPRLLATRDVIIRARSASFLSFGVSSAHARLNLWWLRHAAWRRRAYARST
jgi:ribosomal protein S12 methylthiotransferase